MSAKLCCFCGFLGALMGVGHMTLKSCYWFLFVLMGLLHIEVRSPSPRGKGKGLLQSLRAFARVLRSTTPQGVCLDNLAFLACVLTVLQVYLILGHVVLTCNFFFLWQEYEKIEFLKFIFLSISMRLKEIIILSSCFFFKILKNKNRIKMWDILTLQKQPYYLGHAEVV